MFQGANCSKEQSVPGSKVFQEAKCSRDQNVLRSKMFSEAKYESAKCAKDQSVLESKVCVSPLKTRRNFCHYVSILRYSKMITELITFNHLSYHF